MMRSKTTVVNKRGLHARAAAKFVTLASQFQCQVSVMRGQDRANGKSIMGVMALAASKGAVIEIETFGIDEKEAMQALVALIERGFDERD